MVEYSSARGEEFEAQSSQDLVQLVIVELHVVEVPDYVSAYMANAGHFFFGSQVDWFHDELDEVFLALFLLFFLPCLR